jgi:hypothetical protein
MNAEQLERIRRELIGDEIKAKGQYWAAGEIYRLRQEVQKLSATQMAAANPSSGQQQTG